MITLTLDGADELSYVLGAIESYQDDRLQQFDDYDEYIADEESNVLSAVYNRWWNELAKRI